MSTPEIVGNCPHCGGVVFRKLSAEFSQPRPVTFSTVCPFCRKRIEISLGVQIRVSLVVEPTAPP